MHNYRNSPLLAAVLVTVAAALTLGGCATTQPVGQQIDDATLTARVKTKLAADPQVNPFNIDVDTTNGVVTLRGRVRDDETRAEAEKLAQDTSGVRAVHNEITVGERKTMGERVSDTLLVTEIEGRLAVDSLVNPFNIDVSAQDGVVILTGVVRDEATRLRAAEIAGKVDGVVRVRNEIEVRSGA